ncbi:MAG: hypothetical protein CSA66_06855 [Proteobacteria bacterium]|nr:MAG: hypothetical protein CSA66_06855 [Pseudomonadota bacterium]
MTRFTSRIAGLLALAVALGACAEERPPINRVQANALPKSFFVGPDLVDTSDDPEFYAQGTLIDVGYGAKQDGLFTSTYAQPLSRIKWVITEEHLIARITYERIEDSDGKGAGADTTDGVIAAMYRIESHFDISKAYNPTTGEELNILQENTTDREWDEREYFRVDWSKNLATGTYDFDTLSLMGVYGGIDYVPMAYYVNDPNDPDHPVFDIDGGYFDVTFKAFATPREIDLSRFGWGIDSFPACFLENDFLGGSWPAGTCNPVELTIRQSFRKVEPTDYEPKSWDGRRMAAYGAFFVERFGFSRNYGMSDDKWHRFIARYDIWERSHWYAEPVSMAGPVECFTPHTTPYGADATRDLDEDGTADECELVGGGSQCDTFSQKCTLPYRERTPKTIPWYVTNGSDLRYFDASAVAAHDWDVALRTAVRAAQYSECVRVGDDSCAERWPMYFGQQDENDDAVALAMEVDDCRNGRAYLGRNRDRASCDALADELGAARGYSPGVISIAKMDEMIVLCHSPVQADDPPACGAPDQRLPEGITAEMCNADGVAGDLAATCAAALNVRMGDLRYNQINHIGTPQTPSPWGIYTDAEDPLTGQTISTSVNVWTYINDLWSQKIVDTARYIGGELTDEDITDGDNIRKWALASAAASGGGGSLPRLDSDQVRKRMADFTKGDADHMAEPQLPMDAPAMRAAETVKALVKHVRAHHGVASANAPKYAARLAAAAGTTVEADLMNTMMQELQGVGGLPLSDGVMNLTSPLRGGHPAVQRDIARFKELALAKRGACMMHEAPAPVGMVSIADLLQAKFGAFDATDRPEVQQARAERMRNYIAQRAHRAVIGHEMGHSVGMRHNFVSSSDPWNYRPQYWQLRTKNGTVDTACTELVDDGESCVGPRYFDPPTAEESDNYLLMWMNSSIMEYAGEPTQDMLGPGAWDFAATRMYYGDAVAVYDDPSFRSSTPRGAGALDKMDDFGGIAGFTWKIGSQEIHYSQLQANYDLIKDCAPVDADAFAPARWDTELMGAWHPTFDGGIVQVDGQYSRCKTQPVDYIQWDQQRFPTTAEAGDYYFGGPAVDADGRVRVPYGFATDGWADLGNLSVYRHDNGADPYELFDFLISQQELNHIFDNYRRNRQDFSVRSASARSLWRYNEKLRDAAKGLGLFRTIYKQVALEEGWDFDDFWPEVAPVWFPENILAASVAFDHFTRLAARPQSGAHYIPGSGEVLRSEEDAWGTPTGTAVRIPNGATGYFGQIAFGGRPLENSLADDQGEFDSWYVMNAGSYYDKIWTAMLMTESVDNFISNDRSDFYDARYRSVSVADLFPDGYRRWLSNSLTGDDALKGPRLAADSFGYPLVDAQKWPQRPIGWTSWWTEEPQSCFPADNSIACFAYGSGQSAPLGADAPADTVPLDPQIGWEEQKFFIAWTLVYLPENQQQWWLDMMRIWELGADADPGIDSRIEFHNPTGKHYVAMTFGKEEIFGKTVQKGIAARVLEYANELLVQAYVTDPGPDLDGDGEPDWYIPRMGADGQPLVRWDPTVRQIGAGGTFQAGKQGCNETENYACTCSANRACVKLEEYITVPAFMRQALAAFGYSGFGMQGLY